MTPPERTAQMIRGRRRPRCQFRTPHQLYLAAAFVLACAAPLSASEPAASPSAAAQRDWPVDRGNSAATGAVPQSLAPELVEYWRYEAGEPVESTAVVSGGRVFVADVDGTVHALSLEDGKPLWKKKTEVGFVAPPAVSGELLAIGDLDGVVWALDATSGDVLWKSETGGQIDAGAAITDDLVLVSSQDGSLYAIDRQTGENKWEYETGDQIRCRPTIANGVAYLGGCDASLHTIAIPSGEKGAEPLPLDGPTGSTPAILGNLAFLPTQAGSVLAFDLEQGKQMWSYIDPDRPQEFRNSAAVTKDRVIVTSQNRQVVALDPRTGEKLWTALLRRRADGSPVIAGEDVWIAATDGRLYRLALSDGEEKWQFEFRGSFVAAPAIAGDRMVLVTDDGTVICLGPKR